MPKTQKNIYSHIHRQGSLIRLLFLLFLFTGVLIFSPLRPSGEAAGLSFGFTGSQDVINGMIVSVSQDDTDVLIPAHVNNAAYIVGVTVDKRSSSVVFDDNDTVYVANEGTVEVFVSDQAGQVKEGDLITVSTIGGVGKKADSSGIGREKIVGVAKSAFDEAAVDTRDFSFANSGDVKVGLIRMELLDDLAALQPGGSSIENIGSRIAGKSVSFVQSFVSASIAVVGFVISGALMFGSIRGSFLSIGRNPLSARSIYGGLVRASMLSLSVMMLGVVAGYVVLIV